MESRQEGLSESPALQCGLNTTHRSVDGAVFWPVQASALFPLTGVFPLPSSDHGAVWIDADRVNSRRNQRRVVMDAGR
jgi:hypothetical protein